VLKKNEIARYGEYRIARLVSPPGMPRRRGRPPPNNRPLRHPDRRRLGFA
jgi:hypothetical protein